MYRENNAGVQLTAPRCSNQCCVFYTLPGPAHKHGWLPRWMRETGERNCEGKGKRLDRNQLMNTHTHTELVRSNTFTAGPYEVQTQAAGRVTPTRGFVCQLSIAFWKSINVSIPHGLFHNLVGAIRRQEYTVIFFFVKLHLLETKFLTCALDNDRCFSVRARAVLPQYDVHTA
jgi:hypothetical protein